MYTVENSEIKFSVKKTGAELCSLVKNGSEYIWQADEKFWGSHGPLLFPIVGGVKDDKIKICGKECHLSTHGFLRNLEFDLVEQTENAIVLETQYNEETLEKYPVKFKIVAKYSYENDKFTGSYDIINLDNKVMPFCFGLHNGFNCLKSGEVAEDIYLKFYTPITINKPTRYQAYFMDFANRIPVIENSDILNLNDDWYPSQAPINDDVKFTSFELINKKSGKILDYTFTPNFRMFNVWRAKGSPFVCLEPWTSQCGVYPCAENLEDVPTTKYLQVGESENYSFTVAV